MLPEFLAGSYKRYKQDTALFTTWLAQAASSVGYNPNGTKHPPSQQPEPVAAEPAQSAAPKGARLKGKARKAAKDAAAKVKEPNVGTSESQAPSTVKYTITTGELLRQAEAVAKSSLKFNVKMPTQNEPLLESSNVNNRFSSLKSEETPEADPTDVSEIAAAINIPARTAASAGESEIATYELEDEDEFDEELAFIIFCFFEDLHRTQDFVNELWRKYKARKCDLHTAAVTTNAAFDLVRQAEEDLVAQAPAVLDKKRSYDSIAIIVFYADAFQQVICPETPLKSNESLQTTPFDDFIYLSTAKILMKFTFIADLPEGCDLLYPAPCPPLRSSYISRPELLGTAEMDRKEREDSMLSQLIIDRQLWNTHKQVAGSAFSPPPPEDEFSESLDRLTKKGILSAALVFEARIYLDIQDIMGDDVGRGHQDLLRNAKMIDKIMNLKVIDGAWDVGGTGERWHERDVDVVMRIKQTSINWILETPTNAFPKFKTIYLATHSSEEGALLQASGLGPSRQNSTPRQLVDPPERSSPEKLLHSKAMPSKDSKLSSLSMRHHRIPEGLDPGDPAIPNILRKQLAEEGVVPDDEPFNAEYEENARKLNIKSIQAPKDPNYLFTTNPIYCGIVSFSILTDFEAAGISLSNWHKSIWPTAHLYNALQQSSGISRSWPEMDKLIDLHMNALFADQIPLSDHEYYVRFALALGLSMSSISRNTNHRSNNASQRFRQGANGIKLKTTEVSSAFRQYFEKKSTLEVCLLKLDKLMRDPGSRASRKEKEAWKRPITNLQFLAILEANLPRITQRLRFDYITLTKQCAKLLKDIRQQIMLQFGVRYPMISTEDSADQTLTWVVMNILEQNNDHASSQPGAQGAVVGPQLRVAKEEIEKFLGTYRPQDLISNFNTLHRPARMPSDQVPNHWNISIRHVALSPPGDLVFFVQPNSYYVHSEGPIQTVEGQAPGHILNPKSLVTLQTIARLIMKAFVEGMGAGSGIATSAPWTWATNEPNFARRIIKVMTDMGVRQDLMSMAVADGEELAICDEQWKDLSDIVTRSVG